MSKIIILVVISFYLSSCKKFTEVDFPINQVGSAHVFKTDANAISAVRGMYAEIMGSTNQPANSAVTFYAGMSADDLKNYVSDNRDEFVKNDISTQNHTLISSQLWAPAYKIIYVANLSLEKLQASVSLSHGVQNQLRGECLYLRALHYFLLVNLFGDVPLITNSDYTTSAGQGRAAAALVHAQIIKDLREAAQLLGTDYGLHDKGVPNRWAAKALLAKSFLYQQQWDSARIASNEILQSGAYELVPDLNKVFLKASKETLWQLAPVAPMRNSWEGFQFVPSNDNAVPNYVISEELVHHFETNDLRKANWMKQRTYAGSNLYYPFKYKVKQNTAVTEGQVVMRLGEVVLMHAEALLRQGNIPSAVSDINLIRSRAGLAAVSGTIDADSCMRLLIRERRSELFAEWGNRWFDLKRWNKADEVLGALKGGTWQATDKLYPIPQVQIELNTALVQNPGY